MTKITKRDMFETILGVLEGTVDVTAVDLTEVEDFVMKEIDTLDKRAKAPRKATKAQEANEALKLAILGALRDADEGLDATAVGTLFGIAVQKATPLLGQLVDAGLVARVEGKGKTRTKFVAVTE